jgi:hypothetical protein
MRFWRLQSFLNKTHGCKSSRSRYLIVQQKSMPGKCLILHVSTESSYPSQSLFLVKVQILVSFVASEDHFSSWLVGIVGRHCCYCGLVQYPSNSENHHKMKVKKVKRLKNKLCYTHSPNLNLSTPRIRGSH